jgi:hypothetical protein
VHRLPPTLLALLALGACASEPAPADPDAEPAAAASALEAPETATVALDDGIDARVLAAPANGDPDRVLALTAPVADLPAGAPLLDARRVDGRLLVLHPDHSLWIHDDAGRRRVDDGVEAPLSVRDGSVAYVRGEMPFFEVVLLPDVDGAPQQLTEGWAPAWNPALGPDRAVVFVSSRDGRPAIYRVRPGQTPERVASEGAFPSSVHAPTYDGATLRFEDEAGAAHTLRVAIADRDQPGALR